MNARTIIITGGSQGLGLAIAEAAWSQGYSIALLARSPERLDASQRLFAPRSSQTCTVHPVDLVDESATAAIFEDIGKQHGSVFALVNNAGTWTGGKKVCDLSAGDLRKALDLNLFSAFNATQAFLRLITTVPDRAIINIGATSSMRGGENVFAFSAGKMALRGLSQSLAKEVWREGVHVAHVVVDGVLDNERTRRLNPNLPNHRYLNQASVAATILRTIEQDPSCWTFEWDLRNQNASWT